MKSLSILNGGTVSLFNIDGYRAEPTRYKGINRLMQNRYTFYLYANRTEKRLIEFINTTDQSFDCIIVFKGMELTLETLKACSKLQPDARWININPDDPFNIESIGSSNRNVMDSLSFYDVYCTWSRIITEKLKEHGCKRVEYLPFGYDPDSHVPPREPTSIKPGVISFVGAWDTQREAVLTALADYDLRIYGIGWNRISMKSPLKNKIVPENIYGEALSEVIYSSTVCLNLLRPQNAGAHNMRTFEIPAMGGVMLTARSEEQNMFFPEEEASLMFNDIKDLRRQLDRAIADDVLVRGIRSRSRESIIGHSYRDRAKYLMEIISDD